MYLRASPPDQDAGTARSREDRPAPGRRKPAHRPGRLWPAVGQLIAGRSQDGGPAGWMLPRDVIFGLRSMFVTLTIGVGGSVALIAIANGVDSRITRLVSNPVVKNSRMVDTDLIARILALLTAAVVATMLVNVALNAAVLGEVVMRGRRLEIGIRRGDAAPPRKILAELMSTAVAVALVGTAAGIGAGLLVATLLNAATPLPALPSAWDLVPPPVAATVAIVANLRPAVETVGIPLRDLFGSRT